MIVDALERRYRREPISAIDLQVPKRRRAAREDSPLAVQPLPADVEVTRSKKAKQTMKDMRTARALPNYDGQLD